MEPGIYPHAGGATLASGRNPIRALPLSPYLTTGHNEIEADIIMSRLSEAGIAAWQQGLGGEPGYSGARDVYVGDADLEAAREVLADAKDVDEDELIELSEEGLAEHEEE
jgi:Putative prokaryotic signal transducing protein